MYIVDLTMSVLVMGRASIFLKQKNTLEVFEGNRVKDIAIDKLREAAQQKKQTNFGTFPKLP